ncbi:hypothetical protein J2S97_004223 [Arthrobacter oryzae]|nr:hypothetical protein [Arthrobacter oryzae]
MTINDYFSGVAIMLGSLIAAAGLSAGIIRARSHLH